MGDGFWSFLDRRYLDGGAACGGAAGAAGVGLVEATAASAECVASDGVAASWLRLFLAELGAEMLVQQGDVEAVQAAGAKAAGCHAGARVLAVTVKGDTYG